jgi:hypothetical protein
MMPDDALHACMRIITISVHLEPNTAAADELPGDLLLQVLKHLRRNHSAA